MINVDWPQLALKRVKDIEKRVKDSLKKSGRKDSEAKILAVSKTFPAEALQAFYQAGLNNFAESYINEARLKIDKLNSLCPDFANNIKWHFIGHLQSNKAKYVARGFDTLHSLDSLSLAEELNRRREDHLKPLEVLIQINLTAESQKSGIEAGELEKLLEYLDKKCSNLKPMGLMTMPVYNPNPETSRPIFAALRKLRDKICPNLKELSMGMSGDFEVAIEEGATLVRVGTALFGHRD